MRRGGAWPASPSPPASGSPCPRPARPAPPSLPTGGTRTGRGSWPMGAGYPGHGTRCPPITAHLSSHLTSTQPGEETRAWLGPRYQVSRAARAEQRHSHLHTCLNIYISIIYRYIYYVSPQVQTRLVQTETDEGPELDIHLGPDLSTIQYITV